VGGKIKDGRWNLIERKEGKKIKSGKIKEWQRWGLKKDDRIEMAKRNLTERKIDESKTKRVKTKEWKAAKKKDDRARRKNWKRYGERKDYRMKDSDKKQWKKMAHRKAMEQYLCRAKSTMAK
jgi:hypothetical protein